MHYRRRWQLAAILLASLVLPLPAHAQFAAVEAFLRNVTDLSFYGGFSELSPSSREIHARNGRLASFGVEMLFEIGGIDRTLPAPPPPPRDTTTRFVLRRMELRRVNGIIDTLYVYEPRDPPAAPRPRTERIWTFEMGIGYGQMVGFDLREPALIMRGAVRDLPAASVYLSHEMTGVYGGVRTGFMRTQGLQVVQKSSGASADGIAESFFGGGLAGYAVEFGGVNVFLEMAYSLRHFPSLQWTGDAGVRAVVPRDLRLSGWSITTGIQIGLKD